MIGPELVPENALDNVDVGVSVSDSADLGRLGLNLRHAELAIGEIARAVLVAGGRLTYGGRIKPSGFTQHLMNEVRRYGTARWSLTICLALPEHRKLSVAEIDEIDRQLGTWGRLMTLDSQGEPVNWRRDRNPEGAAIENDRERQASYSALRQFMTRTTCARVLLGGQLTGFQGVMPGLIEEAILAIEQHQPVYLAGGYGGAAAAVVKVLGIDSLEWLPTDLPAGHDDAPVVEALAHLSTVAANAGWSAGTNGLSEEENHLLASSHRPGDIASLVVLGMGRLFGPAVEPGESGDEA